MMTTPKHLPGWADDAGLTGRPNPPVQKSVPVRLPDLNDTGVKNRPTAVDSRRLDEQLRKRVLQQLGDLGEQMRMTVQVAVEQGEVFLKGNVDSNYNRLVITSSVARICGPKNLRDQLSIRSRFGDPTTSRTADSIESLKSKPAVLAGIAAGIALLALIVFTVLSRQGVFLERLHNIPLEVTYNGKPAVGAQLALHALPADSSQSSNAIGIVQEDGTVLWKTGDRVGGVPVGRYVVTAIWHPLLGPKENPHRGRNILPKEYQQPTTTPFSAEVTPQSQPLLQLELKR